MGSFLVEMQLQCTYNSTPENMHEKIGLQPLHWKKELNGTPLKILNLMYTFRKSKKEKLQK